MSEWREYHLDELYTFGSGLSKPSSEFGFGYPFLSFKTVFSNYFLPRELTELVNSTEKERQTCSIKRGDVFLTRTSETAEELGMSSVALKDYPEATFNGFTKRLRPRNDTTVSPEFIGFYLRSEKIRAIMSMMSSETTRASLNNSMMSSISIFLPPLPTQRAIAEVLSSLDDKIDLLTRQNATLEALAQTYFRQWFLEEPNGDWEEKGLDEIAEFLNGLPLQKYPCKTGESLFVIKIKELNSGYSENSDICTSDIPEKYIINIGDIVFSWSGSLIVDIWRFGKGGLNQHLFKVTSDKYPKWFYYYWIKYHLTEFRIIAESKATTMGHIQRGHLAAAKVLVPNEDAMSNMDKILSQIIEKVECNNAQIQTLQKLRDTLLPKLITGEVRVKT